MLYRQAVLPLRSRHVFYGWWIVAAVFVAEMFAIGSTSFAFGVFVVPVGADFGLPRATVNGGLGLILLGMGLSAPLVGCQLDRWPARWVLVSGALALGLGLIGIGLARDLRLIAALLLLLVGPGAGALGPLTAATVVSRWFHRRRGRALGVAAVATSLGGSVLVPVIAYNLALFGWRTTLVIQGAAVVVLVSAVALLIVRDTPEEMGLKPDGSADAPSGPQAASARWGWALLCRQRDFWCIALAVSLTFAVSQSLLVSLVPYALDMGLDGQRASLLVSVLALASVLGKLGFGAVADRVDKRWLLLLITVFILLQLGVLLARPVFGALVVALAITGVATGGELPVWAALVADRFGSASYGTVMGIMNLLVTLGSLAGIYLVGQAYDASGDYQLAFQGAMAAVGAAMLACLLITPRRGPC